MSYQKGVLKVCASKAPFMSLFYEITPLAHSLMKNNANDMKDKELYFVHCTIMNYLASFILGELKPQMFQTVEDSEALDIC